MSPTDQPRLSSHSHDEDERNANIVVGLRTLMPGDALPAAGASGSGPGPGLRILPLREAAVSVMDSGFMLGDGLWEGIRLHNGVLVKGKKHLRRLYEGCLALDMHMDVPIGELERWIYKVVDSNDGMRDGVHIRLMVTRGLKPTPFQSPYITIGNPTVAIIPEYKTASPELRERGLRLFTCHVRRCAPDTQDPMLNSHSKHNCIQACIQAHHAGADEALMLDPSGFVATCNSTNFFICRDGEVLAPSPKYQLHGTLPRPSIAADTHTHLRTRAGGRPASDFGPRHVGLIEDTRSYRKSEHASQASRGRRFWICVARTESPCERWTLPWPTRTLPARLSSLGRSLG